MLQSKSGIQVSSHFPKNGLDQATEGGIVKVGGTLPDKVVLVKFGALIPNIVVIPTGLAAFSLHFSFKTSLSTKIIKTSC